MNEIEIEHWKDQPRNYTGKITCRAYNGIAYFREGLLHREDGIAYYMGYTIQGIGPEYWLDGHSLTFEQFWERQKDTIHAPKIMAEFLGNNE